MELAFVGVTVSVVSVMGVWFGVQLVHMTKSLDAISIASGPQTEIAIYYALHGRWPSPGDQGIVASERTGTYLKHLAVGESGIMTAELTFAPTLPMPAGRSAGVRHGFLSFRPELLGSKDAPSIAYLCGYAAPTAGAVEVTPAGGTTLPRNYLPPFCR